MNAGAVNITYDLTALWRLQGDDLQVAEANARQALRDNPCDARARTVLARASLDRGDEVEAIRLLQQAIYDAPDCFVSYGVLVELHEKLGRRGEALKLHLAWAISAFRSGVDEEI